MASEFVAFDASGKEVDWVDPYLGHRHATGRTYLVDNGYEEYPVEIPEGGRYEIREMEQDDDEPIH